MRNKRLLAALIGVSSCLLVGLIGCDSRDERLHQLSRESLARQAEQNEQMAQQRQTTAEATSQLLEANAESRQEFLELQKEIQSERAHLNRQHEALEQDRQELASERQWESILGPLISSGTGLLIAVLPLLVCLYLLRGMFGESPDEQLGEILVRELAAEKPLLLSPIDDVARQRLVETTGPVADDHRIGLQDARTALPVAEAKLLIVVEGQHDVAFLKQISSILQKQDQGVPQLSELEAAGQIVFVPTGGGDLGQWSDRFANLGQREFHLYDREVLLLTKERQLVVAAVNQRNGCRGVLTHKRSIENYLHPVAIRQVLAVEVSFGDSDDVAEIVARATLKQRGSDWNELPSRARRKLRERAKQRLHRRVVPEMTPELLAERDPDGEVRGWFNMISALLAG